MTTGVAGTPGRGGAFCSSAPSARAEGGMDAAVSVAASIAASTSRLMMRPPGPLPES